MSTSIHLAGPDDATRLLPLMAAFHAERGLEIDDTHRADALAPLLDGSPLGAVWLFGLAKAPTGYVVITFGWSMTLGGMEAVVDELYIRPAVRKRGIGSGALAGLAASLKGAGVKALHLRVGAQDEATQRLYTRAHFSLSEHSRIMTRPL